MKKVKSIILSVILLFLVWIILTGSLSTQYIIAGIVVALIVAFLFGGERQCLFCIQLNPKAILYTFVYVFVFLAELIKSNFDVAYRVVHPSLPIKPGIVKVKTRLNSPVGRLVLANSITLTPGTLTVDIVDEYLYIHWIDVSSEDIDKATENIVLKFEKYLEVMYG